MNEPDNIIDLQPYLDAVKAQEHREQMVNAIMASAEAKSNQPEQCKHDGEWGGIPEVDAFCKQCGKDEMEVNQENSKQCDHGVSFDQVCGQCYARTHSDPFQFTPPRKG